jgi:hypothetical protein
MSTWSGYEWRFVECQGRKRFLAAENIFCPFRLALCLGHAYNMRRRTTNTSKQPSITPEYVGVDQAEVLSGLSRWTWRHYAYAGKIASVKAGKRLLIPVSEIRRVMTEGYRPALEAAKGQL